jgi:hypothetical protein
MPELARVAVIGSGLPAAVALAALVDGGLDAQGVCTATPPPDAADVLTTHGLTERLHRVAATRGLNVRRRRGGGGGFDVVADAETIGRFDAVVLADAAGAAPADADPAPGGAAPGGKGHAPRFGGVFDPDSDGVYLIGGAGELARAQGRWVGEYLRGRYLLPARSVMLAHPGLPPRGYLGRGRHGDGLAGYLARLDRELRRGHARAAAAGYPLPTITPVVEDLSAQTRNG